MEERKNPIFGASPPPPPPVVAGADVAAGGPAEKKKRGRPRKYDADGNLNPAYKSPLSAVGAGASSKISPCLGELFANMAGKNFTSHVLTVHTGEDVVAKIISFSQQAPRGVCVLSANGSVSNVTIRQPCSSGGLMTYEGRFEILSLNGSFTVYGNGGMNSRMGELSVTLSSGDGRVIGGVLAGLLMAASPIQMVVASFMHNRFTNGKKRKKHYGPRTIPLISASKDIAIPATPVSEAPPNINIYPVSETQVHMQSCEEAHKNEAQNNESHNNENHNEAHNNEDDQNMSDKQNPHSSSDSREWNISDLSRGQSSNPDINVSLLVD